MPPRKKATSNPRVSAPPDRVYKSSTPKTQTKLPASRKRIISYGKKTSVRVPKPKQETLTQIWDVNMPSPTIEEEEEDEGGDYEEAAKERGKRRKTMGDSPDRTPSYHTQSITQMDWSFRSAPEEEEVARSIYDVPDSSHTGIPAIVQKASKAGEPSKGYVDLPGLSPSREMPPPKTPRRILPTEIPSSQSPATPLSIQSRGSRRLSPLKETSPNAPILFIPRTRPYVSPGKLPKLEVGDTFETNSEESQATRVPSTPAKRPSPAKSVRFALPDELEDEDYDDEDPQTPSVKRQFTPKPMSRNILDDDEVEDEMSQDRMSPLGKSHPIPEPPSQSFPDEDEEFEEPQSQLAIPRSTQKMLSKKAVDRRMEILDSDAESDEDLEEVAWLVEIADEEDSVEEEPVEAAELMELGDHGEFQRRSTYDLESVGIGGEEEFEDVLRSKNGSRSPELGDRSTFGEERDLLEHKSQDDKQALETCYGNIGLETQIEADRILSTAEPRRTQSTTQPEDEEEVEQDDEEDDDDDEILTDTNIEKTQMMESQRLSTQHVWSMAPRTVDSDVFISVHPSSVTNIVTRTKNHETRNYSFPPTVSRMWLYETAPVSTLKYMAEIGPAKRPGEITDLSGLGNVEFNKKAASWRAYEILQVYELADPRTLAELKENGWLKSAPAKTARVAPAVIDELMANLLPPLFHRKSETAPALPSNDTQEVEEQLMSTIKESAYSETLPDQIEESENEDDDEMETEHPTSGQAEEPEDEIEQESIPSSTQATPLPRRRLTHPPSSQATTVDLTQTQTQVPLHDTNSQSQTEIIWESPARPVPSSTPMKFPTPQGEWDRVIDGQERRHESLVQFSMASSQLLTRSQLLSDSLLNDIVPGPPPFIEDSDDEDE